MYNLETLKELALTVHEYNSIVEKLKREPNDLELGLFGALWSEHCGYKHTKKLLRNIKSTSNLTLTNAGEENAGAINIGDGKAIVMKIESHNHPSAIEPYEGAATGVGGIVRDIFAMGARPIALLNSLRFSNLDNDKNLEIAKGVVRGISGYGNCLGIPNIGGECFFDSCYESNPLVNAMCVGIVDIDKILSAKAEKPGDLLLLVGAETGRDGIHGASGLASQNFEETTELRSAVQVGNPFLEKLLIEACLEISSLKSLVGMQDCGAAGITSAAIEMAKRSNLGINIDVSKVPTRENMMTPYEIMLSESQERMLLAVTANEEKEIFEVFDKWDLKCAIIGEFIEGDDASVFNKNNLLSKTSISVLTDAPEYDLEKIIKDFKPIKHTFKLEEKYLSFEKQIIDKYLNKIIKSNNIVSKKSIFQKYDHHVQTNTVIEPGQDAAIIRIKGTDKMLLFSCDGNSRYCHIDPKIGAEISIAEACRNVSVMGGNPIAITDGLNFGDPTTPRGAYELIETFKGFNSACEKFNIPIISGNASLFNEGHVSSIYPTPIIGVMGIMNKTNKIPSLGFNKIGDLVGLLGKKFWGSTEGLSGSEFQNIISNNSEGELIFDIDYEIVLQRQIRTLADNNLIESAHDTSLGGIMVSLIKACNSKDLGVEINKHIPEDWAPAMFGEDQSRVIFSFKANNKEKIAKVLEDSDWEEIGMVTSKDIIFKNITFETDNLLKNYNKGFSTKL